MRVGPNAQYWPPTKRTHAFDGDKPSERDASVTAASVKLTCALTSTIFYPSHAEDGMVHAETWLNNAVRKHPRTPFKTFRCVGRCGLSPCRFAISEGKAREPGYLTTLTEHDLIIEIQHAGPGCHYTYIYIYIYIFIFIYLFNGYRQCRRPRQEAPRVYTNTPYIALTYIHRF